MIGEAEQGAGVGTLAPTDGAGARLDAPDPLGGVVMGRVAGAGEQLDAAVTSQPAPGQVADPDLLRRRGDARLSRSRALAQMLATAAPFNTPGYRQVTGRSCGRLLIGWRLFACEALVSAKAPHPSVLSH